MLWFPLIVFLIAGFHANDRSLDLEKGAKLELDDHTTVKLKAKNNIPVIYIKRRF